MLKVLIVDDDRIMCDCLRYMVEWEELGCQIPKVAYNGMEAWELLQQEKTDLVISDLKMPMVDGMELCRRIYEEKLHTRIVLLTAYEDFWAAKQCIKYGIEDYILKPINEEGLTNIKNIIKRVREKKEKGKIYQRFYDDEYRNLVLEAISKKDKNYIQKMFLEMHLLDSGQVVTVGMTLLDLLFGYLCKKGQVRAHGVYDSILKKWRKELLEMECSEKKIQYIETLYQREVMQQNDETEIQKTVKYICKIVEENYYRPDCNVSWIAEKVYMNPSYVGKIFAKNMGMGLMEYIIDRRMEQACRMLSEDHISIRQIAIKAGYLDVNYFAKAFKHKTNMSPSEYRRQARKEGGTTLEEISR